MGKWLYTILYYLRLKSRKESEKVKKIISLLLSLAMMMSIIVIPQTSYAYDTGSDNVSANRSNITAVYLGKNNGSTMSKNNYPNPSKNDNGSYAQPVEEFSAGDIIWVGIEFSNMISGGAYDGIFKSSNMSDNSKGGLNHLTVGMRYDANYLEPVYNTSSNSNASRLLTYSGVLQNYTTSTADGYAAKNLYKMNTDNYYVTDTNDAGESLEPSMLTNAADESYNYYVIKPNYTNADIPRMFQNKDGITRVVEDENDDGDTYDRTWVSPALTDAPVLMATFAFKVKVNSSDVTPGTTVLQTAMGGVTFTVNDGATSETDYSWDANRSYGASVNLKNYFDLVGSDGSYNGGVVDLFPQTYNVKYYTDDTCTSEISGKGATGVPEGTKVSDASVTAPTVANDGGDIPLIKADGGTTKYFTKWVYTDSSGTEKDFEDTTVIGADSCVTSGDATVKVYPKYENAKEIKFNSNYPDSTGTDIKTIYVSPATSDVKIDSADFPTEGTDFTTPDGYAFVGWNTQANGSGTDVDADTDIGSLLTSGDTLYAKYEQKIVIKFYEDKDAFTAGTETYKEMFDVAASVGPLTSFPSDPTARTGYEWDGWFIADNDGNPTTTEVTAASTFTGSINVVGKWTKLHKVTFLDEKTSTSGTEVTVRDGDKVASSDILTVTDNDTDHKYFKGWLNKTDDSAVDFDTLEVNADIEVYKDWGDYWKVNFWSDAADIGTDAKKLDTKYVNPNAADKTVGTLPANPTKDGYGFDKWVENGTTNEFKADTIVSGDTDVVAEWTLKATITFKANHGTFTVDGSDTDADQTTLTTPNVTFDGTVPTINRNGYTLSGWNTKSNGSGTSYSATLAKAVFTASETIYAQWTADGPTKAKLTFVPNLDGVTVNPSFVEVNANDYVTDADIPDDPTMTDYDFKGWFKSPSITSTPAVDFTGTGYQVTADESVYGHWEYTGADAVTVEFYDDSNKLAEVKVKSNTTLGNMMPDSSTIDGFKEWNTASDGTGTVFTDSTLVGTDTPLKVYAVKYPEITVNYDGNGVTANVPSSTTKRSTESYTDPGDNGMTKTNYLFMGWNTAQNGSGTYIPGSATSMTYGDVANAFATTDTPNPTNVTLYAQWEAVSSATGNPSPDPSKHGVEVIFDSNAPASDTSVVAANPSKKFPSLGDAIGTGNMPNVPTRDNYTAISWNTKADGTGKTVDGTTTIDTATLGDALIANGDGTYKVTVYAQWKVADDYTGDKVTLTFNDNKDGKGDSADNRLTYTIVKGDKLGFVPGEATNGDTDFGGWYTGAPNGDGVIDFTGSKFDENTAASADTTYYAQWICYLLAEPQSPVAPHSTGATAVVDLDYTGEEQKVTYKIFKITYPDNDTTKPYTKVDASTPIYTGDFTDTSDYTVSYTKDSVAAALKDVGEYIPTVSTSAALNAQGYKIMATDPAMINVNEAELTFKLDPETQKQKAGEVTLPTFTVTGKKNADTDAGLYKVVYKEWTDTNSDGVIDADELAEIDMTNADNQKKIGKYVMQIVIENKNYKIGSVESSVDGKTVSTFDTATFPTGTVGTNLVFEIVANDPSVSAVTVESAKNDDSDKMSLDLKESDYVTNATLLNPGDKTDADKNVYYVRVTDKTAEKVTFTLTMQNPDSTSLTIDTTNSIAGATASQDSTTKVWTITAPLTNKAPELNVIKFTTKAGDAADAPTIDYTFNVQQLTNVRIEMNPGNSPFGLIERMGTKFGGTWSDTDIETAKTAFDNSDAVNKTYDNAWIPTDGQTAVPYTTVAWESIGTNYDMDSNAIFVYEAATFTDPGFKIYDEAGEVVALSAANFSKKLEVKEIGVGVPTYDASEGTDIQLTETDGKYDLSGKIIRPDKYEIVYTYNYTSLDDGTAQTFTASRPTVILSKRGDIQLTTTPYVNVNDSTQMQKIWGSLRGRSALFAFRTADIQLTTTPYLNVNDATTFAKIWGSSLDQYYTTLD